MGLEEDFEEAFRQQPANPDFQPFTPLPDRCECEVCSCMRAAAFEDARIHVPSREVTLMPKQPNTPKPDRTSMPEAKPQAHSGLERSAWWDLFIERFEDLVDLSEGAFLKVPGGMIDAGKKLSDARALRWVFAIDRRWTPERRERLANKPNAKELGCLEALDVLDRLTA